MGLRFRRSIRVAPGVRINVGKSSLSVTAGQHGAELTSGTAGTRITAGAPGTGLSYTEKIGAGQHAASTGSRVAHGSYAFAIGFLRGLSKGILGALAVLFAGLLAIVLRRK
jgi:hypothetical protein